MTEIRDSTEQQLRGIAVELVMYGEEMSKGNLQPLEVKAHIERLLNAILAIHELAVVNRDAKLPENPYQLASDGIPYAWKLSYQQAQWDMRK